MLPQFVFGVVGKRRYEPGVIPSEAKNLRENRGNEEILRFTQDDGGCTEFRVKQRGTAILAVFLHGLEAHDTKFCTVPDDGGVPGKALC